MDTATAISTILPEALVVEGDPGTRGQLVSALSRQGYGIDLCGTLREGREHFHCQPLIVTHANGDTTELQGFVDFVRRQAGDDQPYILAVCESESPTGIPPARLGLNDFLTTPLDETKLDLRLAAITHWLAGRGYSISLSGPTESPVATAGKPECMDSIDWEFSASTQPKIDDPAPANDLSAAASVADVSATCSSPRCDELALILFNESPLAMAVFDPEMRILLANDRCLRDFGLSRDEVIGRNHYELFPDLHESWRQLFDRALEGEAGRIDEDIFRRADGTSDVVRWDVRPWRHADGLIGGVLLTQEVITAQKRGERRALFEHNFTKSLFEDPVTPAFLVRLDGRILRSSPAARSRLDLQPAANGRLPFWEVFPDAEQKARERERFENAARQLDTTGQFEFAAGEIIVSGPTPGRLIWSASPHVNSTGKIEAVLFTGVVQPEEKPPSTRPENFAALARVVDNLPLGLVLLNRTGDIVFANDSLGEWLGFGLDSADSLEDWLARACADGDCRELVLREWRESVWRRQMTRVFSLVTSEGRLREIEVRPRLLRDGSLLLTFTDVTEPRRAEDALRASEAKFRALFQESPTGIALADRTGAIIDANPALENLLGASRLELRRSCFESFLDADDFAAHRDDLLQMARGERPSELVPARVNLRDGGSRPVHLAAGSIRNTAGETILTSYFIQAAAQNESPVCQDPAPNSPEPRATTSLWRDLAFDGLATAMLVTDLRGRIVDANPAAEQFFGCTREELDGSGLYRLFMPDDPAEFSRRISDEINLNHRWEAETTFTRANGTTGQCRAEIFRVRGRGTSGLLCIAGAVVSTEFAAGESGSGLEA